jgi:hypothetical protein
MMALRKEAFNNNKPLFPLSKLAKADPKSVKLMKRRPFLMTGQQVNPKAMKRVNRVVAKQAGGAVDDIWNKEGGSLRDKFFLLDHTAEVLENYRRIKENEIFQSVLFEEREKRAFLKKEGRRIENLIENYDQHFSSYKYLAGTQGGSSQEYGKLFSSKQLFLEEAQISRGDAAATKLGSS